MIELYLSIGIFIAICNLFLVYSKPFDDYSIKQAGIVIKQWKKITFVFLLVPLWPLFILTLVIK